MDENEKIQEQEIIETINIQFPSLVPCSDKCISNSLKELSTQET